MKHICCSEKCGSSVKEALLFLKIISDENRLKIICLLSKGDMCVCEIWEELGITQNLASYHLKALKDFKLLKSKKKGLKVIYSLNKKELSKYNKVLNHFLNHNRKSK